MTVEGTIKAAECLAGEKVLCENCEYSGFPYPICSRLAAKDTLALINRQKADIERLQSMNQSKLDTIHDLRAEIEELKLEMSYMSKPNTIGDKHEMGG